MRPSRLIMETFFPPAWLVKLPDDAPTSLSVSGLIKGGTASARSGKSCAFWAERDNVLMKLFDRLNIYACVTFPVGIKHTKSHAADRIQRLATSGCRNHISRNPQPRGQRRSGCAISTTNILSFRSSAYHPFRLSFLHRLVQPKRVFKALRRLAFSKRIAVVIRGEPIAGFHICD